MPDRDELLALMQSRRGNLRGLGYRVLFEIEETGEAILLDGTGPSAEVSASEPGVAADTVLRLSSQNLRKLIEGRLSPMLAFSTGKLRVEGSKGVALKLASLLDED